MIFPAIDLLDGKAVRLHKGDYKSCKIYSDKPIELAKKFKGMGAGYLHVVDLDGARDGAATNFELIKEMCEEQIAVQVGGGIRTPDTIDRYLNEAGASRVILGTSAIKNPGFVESMVTKHGNERIAIGVDVRDEKVSINGWKETSDKNYLELISELKQIGVDTVIATDISKDGTLSGPNWEMYEKITDMNVIVSGGIACEDDIRKARKFHGVIVGKAFYEGKVDLPKLINEERRL